MKNYAIAIDGPAGSGKSTVAKLLSKILDCKYVDTGATFRAVAVKVMQKGLDTKNKEDVLNVLEDLDMKVTFEKTGQVVYLDGVNVNDQLRTPEADIGSSNVSVFPEVRLKLIEIWRDIANNNNVVMDGRDVGTLVLPDANVKIFLTASLDARAKRRLEDAKKKDNNMELEEIKQAIIERDYQDENKELGSLAVAQDAITIDTTDMTIDNVVNKIVEIVEENVKK